MRDGREKQNKQVASVQITVTSVTASVPICTSLPSFLCLPSRNHLSRFDLLANGGASLTLRFERAPFLSQERTVWLPWSQFYAMDTLVLKTEENTIPGCDLSGFVRPDPLVIASPLSSFFSSKPGEKPIIPETQVRYR